jgi:hypothetical protein
MDTVTRLRRTWDWVLGFALIAVAAVLVVAGSVATSNARHVIDQVCFIISGGLGGLLLLGAGSTLVISAGLADEARKLDRLEEALPFRLPGGSHRSTAALLRRGRILAAAGMLAALSFVVAAYVRASGEPNPNPAGFEAIGTGAIGLVAGALAAALATLWVKRTIQIRKSRLLLPWTMAQAVRRYPVRSETASGSAGSRALVAPGLTRFHAPGCLAVQGLAASEVDTADVPAGLTPCELCHTDAAQNHSAPRPVFS